MRARSCSFLPAGLGLALLGVLLAASPAAASTVSYNEAVSGDLDFALPMASPFVLGAGTNTVTGSMFDSATAFDADSFAFTVPNGMAVTGIDLSFTTTPSADANFISVRYGLSTGNAFEFPPTIEDVTFDVLAPSPGAVFGSHLPLGPGLYGLSWLGTNMSASAFSMDYTWTFTVDGPSGPQTAVPEPASLVLFATGVIGAGVRRFRSRRRAC